MVEANRQAEETQRAAIALRTKKDGTNISARAGRPVTQFTSRSGAVDVPPPSLEYIQLTIDFEDVKYKKRNLYKLCAGLPVKAEASLNSKPYPVEGR